MAKFLTPLHVELVNDDPVRWRLVKPLAYESDAAGILVVPSDFETDFASVPRLPLVFLMAGETCHRAAVVHDWLYSPPERFSRSVCDKILREAAQASGVSFWRRWLVWAGVRVGGGGNYQESGA